MAGELGQSLCRHMVKHGARHIVLLSRHAVRDLQWLRNLRVVAGVNGQVVKMDLTHRMQVQRKAATSRDTMPKIAVVANAALVLQDYLFINTAVVSFTQLTLKWAARCILTRSLSTKISISFMLSPS